MAELRSTDIQLLQGGVARRESKISRMEEYIDSEGITRYKLVTGNKWNDEVKTKFLEEFAKHGRHGTAARIAGVSVATVKKYMEKDAAFGEACAEAMECYHDRLIEHHQNLVFNGTVKTTYGRDGSIVSEETIYPQRLIELELKKHDEGYRDKKDVTVNVKGGVLVAPATVSMDEWEKKFGSPVVGDIVDAEVLSDVSDIGEDTTSHDKED
jgi:hypothetical protein